MDQERKKPAEEEADGLIEGRNAVIEALRAGEHIDKIVQFLKRIILSEYNSRYDASIEDKFDNAITNDTLNAGVNSTQGHAIQSLAKIGKLQKRKTMVYDFFMDTCDELSIEHQLTVMLYLQRECYDNELYNMVMFRYANRSVADYLFLNADRMHWFWCNLQIP